MRSAGLVLAAGSSRRMGRPKQLLEISGRPLLELVTSVVAAAQLDEVVVVLGGNAEEVAASVDLGRGRVVVNHDHATGMSSSLKVGIAALGPDIDRVVIVLGDQPDVSAALIDALLDLQESTGLAASALSLDGLLHPPVVLARRLWPELAALEGDVGCRAVIRGRPEDVAALAHAGRHGHPVDIDTQQDYEDWKAGHAADSTGAPQRGR